MKKRGRWIQGERELRAKEETEEQTQEGSRCFRKMRIKHEPRETEK